jgi:ribosomal protein L14
LVSDCYNSKLLFAYLMYKQGDRIIVVVQKQRNFAESGPGASVSTSAANKVRRGDIRHAVVVRTRKKLQRPDGSVVKFDDNACVLINKAGEPIGTRLNGALFYALLGILTNRDRRCRW